MIERLVKLSTWMIYIALVVSCGGGDSSTATRNPEDPGDPPPPPHALCIAGDRPVWNSSPLSLQRAFPNISFNRPIGLFQEPGNDQVWYAIEQAGRIFRFNNVDNVTALTLVLDIRNTHVESEFMEGGLLGMVFDPDFSANRFIYLSYTTSDAPGTAGTANFRSIISRVTLDPAFTTSAEIMATEKNILVRPQPFENHNGGHILFGPDNYLYIGFGDGGGSGSNRLNSQDTTNLLGSLLRINVRGVPETGTNILYTIPLDNPFNGNALCSTGSGAQECPEIYAWGLRNPWRWSFDRSTGALWLADVGYNNWEEIDLITLGGNYGWPCYEGTHTGPNVCNVTDHTTPIYEYDHSFGISITGGYIYRGVSAPSQIGQYIFGDFGGGIWTMSDYQTTPTVDAVPGQPVSVTAFAEDQNGEIFAITYSGEIYELVSDGSSSNTNIGGQLSATGCALESDPKLGTVNMMPYNINAKLWSDNAIKSRWFALPEGGQISLQSGGDRDGDWDFPIGSVLRKDFYLNGNIIETRLLAHHNDGTWGGYAYEWNGSQTDATVVLGGKTKTIDTQEWSYPSEFDCFRCHTAAAGVTVGPETGQMNRDHTYPDLQTRNQLDYYTDLGLFANALPAQRQLVVEPEDTGQSTEDRAKAYLHANCAHCHRPGGPTPVNIDFRYDTALAGMNICDAVPSDDFGLGVTARIFLPADPANSTLSLRMGSTDPVIRMPALGTAIVDTNGTGYIDQWITDTIACPP